MRRRTSWTCRRSSSRVRSVAGWRSVRLEDIDPVPVEGGRILWRPVRRMLDWEPSASTRSSDPIWATTSSRSTRRRCSGSRRSTSCSPAARRSSSTARRSMPRRHGRLRPRPGGQTARQRPGAADSRSRDRRPTWRGLRGTAMGGRAAPRGRGLRRLRGRARGGARAAPRPTGTALRRRTRGGPRGPLRRRQRPPPARARAPSDAGGLGPRERGSRLAPGPPGLAGCTEMTSRATLPPYRHRR
jgi:hypothetical protein